MVESLVRWVADEFNDTKYVEGERMKIDTSLWKRDYPKTITVQRNSFDCDVFALQVGCLPRTLFVRFARKQT